MAEKNYYEILGVNYYANAEQIKTAYRNLARKFHPDINESKNAALILSAINEAYSVLSDASKRKHYDLYQLKNIPEIIEHPLNIKDVYKKIVEMRKRTVQLNKFRMDKEGLFRELFSLVDDKNILLINQSDNTIAKKNLSEEVLGIAELLFFKDQQKIANQLMKISIDNSHVHRFLRQQKWIHFFQKYSFLIAMIAAGIFIFVLINIF